jgi:hypothetical protein
MNRAFTLIIGVLFAFCANAQTGGTPIKFDEPYGVIDTADLTMKQCDFEKDASAEVLFDYRTVEFIPKFTRMDRHIRIKIFNSVGEKYAAMRIPVYKGSYITDDMRFLKAQTINLVGNTIVYTPVEKKYIYTEKTNQNYETICISMPDITPGSIFEVSYSQFTHYTSNVPQWFPQGPIPVRYTQLHIDDGSTYVPNTILHINQPFACDTSQVKSSRIFTRTWALANLPSYKKEAYAGFVEDGLQYITFALSNPSPPQKIRNWLFDKYRSDTSYSMLSDTILKALNKLNTREEILDYVFNIVKTQMKWNGHDDVITYKNAHKIWENKIGTATEINLVLYKMLTQIGIPCDLLAVSTHDHPRLNFDYLYTSSFNRMVVYVPFEGNQNFILDASSKYNNYKQTPIDLLDLKGMIINESNKPLQMATMRDNEPAISSVFINAAIKSDAKMSGTATITQYSYNKILNRRDIDTTRIDNYKVRFANKDNNLKISSLTFENMDVDTLPLIQHADFDYDLGGVDGGYIYFKPDIFAFQKNPFIRETRLSDIYFGYRLFFNITGNYKIPTDYKVDAMPKNTTIIMPDSSIIFKRFTGVQEDGSIQIRYMLHFNKSLFLQDEYQALYVFYRKMYEALNEQIILKKS